MQREDDNVKNDNVENIAAKLDAVPAPEADAGGEPVMRGPQPRALERRPSRKAAWLAMAAVAAALTLLWMGSELGTTHEEPVLTGADGEPGDAQAVGRPAPLQYTLKDMNGVDVQLASFKGKVIVLNFWATWCGPCRAEIPWLIDLQAQYPDDLVVLGVEVDGPAEKVKPYASEMKMNYPVLLAYEREDVQDAYGPLWGIPVSVFVDRTGTIARKHSGIASKEEFEREIKGLL